MVDVHIRFSLRSKRWTLDFNVDPGATVLELKEVILQHRGIHADIDAFELWADQKCMSDDAPILKTSTFEFRFLGRKEGARRAAIRQMKLQSCTATPDGAAILRVQHMTSQKKLSEVLVNTPKDATIHDVRKAVLAVICETRWSELKIADVQTQGHTAVPNTSKIGDTREFLALCKRLKNGEDQLVQSKAAARSKAQATEVHLTTAQAVMLQKELYIGFSHPRYHEAMDELERAYPEGSRQYNVERQKLIRSVQSGVIQKYGLEPTFKGIMRMVGIIRGITHVDSVHWVGYNIERILSSALAVHEPARPVDFPVHVRAYYDWSSEARTHDVTLPRGSSILELKHLFCTEAHEFGVEFPIQRFYFSPFASPFKALPDDMLLNDDIFHLKVQCDLD